MLPAMPNVLDYDPRIEENAAADEVGDLSTGGLELLSRTNKRVITNESSCLLISGEMTSDVPFDVEGFLMSIGISRVLGAALSSEVVGLFDRGLARFSELKMLRKHWSMCSKVRWSLKSPLWLRVSRTMVSKTMTARASKTIY